MIFVIDKLASNQIKLNIGLSNQRMILIKLLAILLILSSISIIESSEINPQRSFDAAINIRFNNEGTVLPGHFYFDINRGLVRIDYNIPSKSYIGDSKGSIVNYFYDLNEGTLIEVIENKCSKYMKREELPFPIRIPSNAQLIEPLTYVEKPISIWRAEIVEDGINKNIEWYINNLGYIEMIKVYSPWGIEKEIEFKNIKSLDVSIALPISDVMEDLSNQLLCDRITEKFSTHSKTCPRGCSSRGLCIDSTCYCYHQFGGKDCSKLPEEVQKGICGNGILEEGEECDDGNNLNDDCCSSECKVQRVDQSCVSGNPCRMPFGKCSANGVCESEIDVNGFCSDDNACTDDVCIDGECVSTPKDIECPNLPYPLAECNVYHSCDPKTGGCRYKPKEDGAKCSGSSPCSGVCLKGRCEDLPISCNNTKLCHESYCDAKSGECYSEPLKDGSPCFSLGGCKYICHSGMCLMGDMSCPQLPVERKTNIAIVIYPEQKLMAAASEILRQWTLNEKARVSLIIGNEVVQYTFEDAQSVYQKLNSFNPDISVSNQFLKNALSKAVEMFSNVEGDDAHALIVFAPIVESDRIYFDEQRGHLSNRNIELFVISSTPKLETMRSMFTFLEERHYIGNLNSDERIQNVLNIISGNNIEKRHENVKKHICGDYIVEHDEECDSPDPCCVNCQWKTCPDVGCNSEGECVNGECEYRYTNCTHLNTQCTQYSCTSSGCLGQNLIDTPCDDGNPCTLDDRCSNGVCSGTPIVCDSVLDDCIEGVCNPFTGQCEEILLNGTLCLGGEGTCINGECIRTRPPIQDDCDPSNPISGIDGICCFAGEQEEVADCASPDLYFPDCVNMSWCSSGTCVVELKPFGSPCQLTSTITGSCTFEGSCVIGL